MEIWELFRGYELAYGTYDVRRTSDRGKAEGKAQTIKGRLTAEMWQAHLAGEGPGIGVIPLLEDNTVVWSVLDIDVIGIDHTALEAKVEQFGLPLVTARSKSGGAHLFLFLAEPARAGEVMSLMGAWAAVLGYGGCEVFPKQSSRFDAKDVGNWLNMPYYEAKRTLRYGIKDGAPLTLRDFCSYAESKKISFEEASKLTGLPASPMGTGRVEGAGDIFYEGPPCLQALHAHGGFPEGTRNEGLSNTMVYLRHRFPDNWKDRAQEYNLAMCDPPLSLPELNSIVKSADRKTYAFRCSKAPLASHCHRRECLSRKFGVGESPEGEERPPLSGLTKYKGDPVIWYLDVNGERLQVTTEELLNQNLFKRKVADAINRVIRSVPQPRWDRYIDELMRDCDEVEVPDDASPTGHFQALFDNFIRGQAQATSKDELAIRWNPYRTGEGEVWFRGPGLFEFLNRHGYKYKSQHHVWQMLRAAGATKKLIQIAGRPTNVWIVKDEGEMPVQETPKFGSEEF